MLPIRNTPLGQAYVICNHRGEDIRDVKMIPYEKNGERLGFMKIKDPATGEAMDCFSVHIGDRREDEESWRYRITLTVYGFKVTYPDEREYASPVKTNKTTKPKKGLVVGGIGWKTFKHWAIREFGSELGEYITRIFSDIWGSLPTKVGFIGDWAA